MTRPSSTPAPRPGAIDRATRAVTLGAIRSPWRVLLVALALFSGSLLLASRLRVDGDFARLLPTESPTAKRFFRTLARKGGASSTIAVVIESKDAVSNQRMADAVADRLRKLPAGVLRSVEVGPGAAREFFRDHRWLFASLPDLERAACELDLEVTRRDPASLGLEESCDDEHEADKAGTDKAGAAAGEEAPKNETPLARVRRKLTARMREVDRFPTGYFRTPAGEAFVVIVRADSAGMGDMGSEAILSRVERAVADVPRAGFEPDTRVVFGGDIPTSIAERNALIEDMTLVSGAATLLILGSIVLFFRTPLVLLQIGSCVAVGCAFAFATAQVAYGHLNAATSFLASIIAGNGINAPIVYIARFRELRGQGLTVEDAAVEAAISCRNGTFIGALAASGAYAALLSTSFRGFSEFGLIGASGMLACWVATFVVCPAALAVSDRGPPVKPGRVAKTPRFSAFAARLSARSPRWVLGTALLVTLVLCLPVGRYLRDPWEYNFARLRSRASAQTGASRASSVVDKVIGGRGSPILLLANDRAEASDVAAEVLRLDRQPGRPPVVEKVETVEDRLGGPPAVVSRKMEIAAHVRETIDRLSKRLSGEDLRFAKEWRPPDDLRPLTPEDLPDLVAQQFREADGRVGTPVYVTLDGHLSQSRGENLLRIADLLQSVHLADGSVAPNASRAAVFAEMIRAMSHDGPKATALAFAVVVLVTLFVARRALPVVAVLGSLLVGVAWTVGFAAWFDVRLNFLNFVALPLTFGIGVEYAINLFERVRVSGGDVEAGITSAGGPVMLCSLTTILGYGSLLFADNRALNSFGAYAIAGEFSCIVTALLVMPAALSFAHHSRARSHAPTVG